LTDAAVQTVDGDHDGRPLEHFYEPVQQVFMVMGFLVRGILPRCAGHP
jgi:hypothetical protein